MTAKIQKIWCVLGFGFVLHWNGRERKDEMEIMDLCSELENLLDSTVCIPERESPEAEESGGQPNIELCSDDADDESLPSPPKSPPLLPPTVGTPARRHSDSAKGEKSDPAAFWCFLTFCSFLQIDAEDRRAPFEMRGGPRPRDILESVPSGQSDAPRRFGFRESYFRVHNDPNSTVWCDGDPSGEETHSAEHPAPHCLRGYRFRVTSCGG